jgi:hypothetical protein
MTTCPFCGNPMKVLREIDGMPVVEGCDCPESEKFIEDAKIIEAENEMERKTHSNGLNTAVEKGELGPHQMYWCRRCKHPTNMAKGPCLGCQMKELREMVEELKTRLDKMELV